MPGTVPGVRHNHKVLIAVEFTVSRWGGEAGRE